RARSASPSYASRTRLSLSNTGGWVSILYTPLSPQFNYNPGLEQAVVLGLTFQPEQAYAERGSPACDERPGIDRIPRRQGGTKRDHEGGAAERSCEAASGVPKWRHRSTASAAPLS